MSTSLYRANRPRAAGMSRARTLVFAYSEMGARCLEILLEHGVDVVAVYTHRDDPHELRWFRCVAGIANARAVPVRRPARLSDPRVVDEIRELGPDLILSFYYRRLIPPSILSLPRLGAFNMHGSLLPLYRGRAPVNWAILRGESRTGATLHHMVEEPDAGDIVDQESVPIEVEDTAMTVQERVNDAGCAILIRQLPALLRGSAPRRPQDERRATSFGRRTPEDGRIDWRCGAEQIANLVRAVAPPFPGAFTEIEGRRLFVWRARPARGQGLPGTVLSERPLVVACGRDALEIVDWMWCSPEAKAPLRVGECFRQQEPPIEEMRT